MPEPPEAPDRDVLAIIGKLFLGILVVLFVLVGLVALTCGGMILVG